MKQTEKGLINRKSGGRRAHSQARDRLRFDSHTVAHFPDGCVCLWIRGLFQFQRFHTAARQLETASFIVNTPFRCFSHATGQSPAQRVRSKVEGEKRPANNRVVTRILMIFVEREKHIGRTCARLPQSPK